MEAAPAEARGAVMDEHGLETVAEVTRVLTAENDDGGGGGAGGGEEATSG